MRKLLITSTDLMMIQFLVPHVTYLSENGFHVELACSEVGGRMAEVREALGHAAKSIHTVRLERSPANPRNLLGYADMRRLLQENQYDIIWTNEPVMGVVTRLAARDARRSGTQVVYMCHGFHFFKGASKLNWLVFYPIELFMSRFCDCIVTINREDETRAKTFHCPRVEYIHGIGIDTTRLHLSIEVSDIRAELSLDPETFLVLSVGELNENKNHQVIIRAIAKLKDLPDVHYCICGKGALLGHLTELAASLGVSDRVHFLGYRTDVVDICAQADVFAFPSHREGLGLAPLEAMYCGLPLIASSTRGVVDYAQNVTSGYLLNPNDAEGFSRAIRRISEDTELRTKISEHNRFAAIPYTISLVKQEILSFLCSLTSD